MKTVTMTEEFQIPGTEVILEAGDQITLKESTRTFGSESIRAIRTWAANDFAKWWDKELEKVRNLTPEYIAGAAERDSLAFVFNDMRLALEEEVGTEITLYAIDAY